MQDKTKQDPVTDEFMELRSRAEAVIREKAIEPPDVSTLPTEELQRLVHELHVHQIELKAQNEELNRTQQALEDSRNEFQDLYDFAPVGYFVLTPKGLIMKVNLTGASLFRMPRAELIGRGFGRFVTTESLDEWEKHIRAVIKTENRQTCDLTLQGKDGSPFYGCVESVRMEVTSESQAEEKTGYVIQTQI